MASARPSPATRVVLKMPAAMPARSTGTTLMARPSIKPQGRLMPQPISSSGPSKLAGGWPGAQVDNHSRPPAASSKPQAQMCAAAMRCAAMPARTGSTSMGADRAIIMRPALKAL